METNLHEALRIQSIIVPEMMTILFRRYEILNIISSNEPIGRRNISSLLGLGEKIVRNESGFLQEKLLVHINNRGMCITDKGRKLLEDAESWIYKLRALDDLGKDLAEVLSVKKVIISFRDTNNRKIIMQETGKKAAEYLKSIISDDMNIGITGGTTMAATVREMPKFNFNNKNITIIPARGGLGVDVEIQANSIAAILAERLNCSYQLLHLTENLSKELLESLREYPEIKGTMEYIEKIDTLIFGIGRADVMAERRHLKDSQKKNLNEKGAVAEAFGYYFDEKGKIVDVVNTVGITLEQYNKLDHIICVASGIEKASAIRAVSKLNPNLVLIIDEALAKAILKDSY